MTVLAGLTVLAVLESTLSSFCLFYKIQYQETTVTVFGGFGGSVVTATPLKLNPPFFVILTNRGFPTSFGKKVQIVSRTLSGLFLV